MGFINLYLSLTAYVNNKAATANLKGIPTIGSSNDKRLLPFTSGNKNIAAINPRTDITAEFK
ncbi:hypothetical protein M2375_002783 [Comamonas sp. BIGb0152]|nr:hypothetical protein [Comamonas sp. BIGb0152]